MVMRFGEESGQKWAGEGRIGSTGGGTKPTSAAASWNPSGVRWHNMGLLSFLPAKIGVHCCWLLSPWKKGVNTPILQGDLWQYPGRGRIQQPPFQHCWSPGSRWGSGLAHSLDIGHQEVVSLPTSVKVVLKEFKMYKQDCTGFYNLDVTYFPADFPNKFSQFSSPTWA